MKKTVCIALLIATALTFGGCKIKAETGRKAIDCRYTASRSEVVTDYQHKYSLLRGEFVLVPNICTVTRPEVYEILYKISYDDGTTTERWQQVDKAEYEAFKGGVQ